MKAILKRELGAYFKGFTGYVYIFFILLFMGILCYMQNVQGRYPSFEYAIGNMSFIYIAAIPILTMRVFSEEKHQKTDQLLYALPFNMNQVVMGKTFAMMTVMVIPVAISCIFPLILSRFGETNLASAYGSIVAFFILGIALASIGIFISALTDNQMMAAGLCFFVMLVNYFVTTLVGYLPTSALSSFISIAVVILAAAFVVWYLTKNTLAAGMFAVVVEGANWIYYSIRPIKYGGLFTDIIKQLSMFSRYDAFIMSEFDLAAIFYYISIAFLFLFFTVQLLEKRRWS
ncbi:MAG: ABC transporter permease subunit [Clostridiales bacterium]|jgi:ABC-2 type transport system permease protein|nr:ABC transporter permease subunit [Clostridiales bacterium]